MALEDMNKAELIKEAGNRKIELPPRVKKAEILKLLKKPVIEQTEETATAETVETPELSETPVIEDEQATAPVEEASPETDEPKPDLPSPTAEPAETAVPVICAGCKMIVDSDTTEACLNPDCKGSLVFCPMCASAKTCHKCGKKLDPNED